MLKDEYSGRNESSTVGRSQNVDLPYDITLGFIMSKMYSYYRFLSEGVIYLDFFLKKISSENIKGWMGIEFINPRKIAKWGMNSI